MTKRNTLEAVKAVSTLQKAFAYNLLLSPDVDILVENLYVDFIEGNIEFTALETVSLPVMKHLLERGNRTKDTVLEFLNGDDISGSVTLVDLKYTNAETHLSGDDGEAMRYSIRGDFSMVM